MAKMLVITSYVQNFHNYRDGIIDEVHSIYGDLFDTIDETEDFAELTYEKLSEYAMVFIYSPQTWGLSADSPFLCALTKYMILGGNVLHCHIACFASSREGKQILNGGFRMHPPYQPYTFVPTKAGEAFLDGCGEYTHGDEAHLLYSERFLDREILLSARLQEGRTYEPGVNAHQDIYAQSSGLLVPLAWKYTYGSGKMFYCCPGHSVVSFLDPHLRVFLRKGAEWLLNA